MVPAILYALSCLAVEAAEPGTPRQAVTVEISVVRSDTRSIWLVITNVSTTVVKLPDTASLTLAIEGAGPDHRIDTCFSGDVPLARGSLAPGETLSTRSAPDDLFWSPCISSSVPWGSRTKVVPADRYAAKVTLQLREPIVSNTVSLRVGR
jgi:hypothetical protein